MTEFMRLAWMGWLDFTSSGKLSAMFLVALIYLWLSGKWKEHKSLFFYAVSIALCCILPVTAAVLMLYQTRYYDYVWLWSLVPMTTVTAWAAVEVIIRLGEGKHITNWKKWLPATVLLFAVLILSSGSAENFFEPSKERQERQRAWEVLGSMEKLREEELCLWAPREILAHVREFDSSVRLIYGRDMWDFALGGYTYDVYPDGFRELYLWMENVGQNGMAEVEDAEQGNIVLSGVDCVTAALEEGVNCILLPECIESGTVQELAETVGVELSQVGEYYLLTR